ncbi:hypothetical protein SMICM17S_11066 [Streptomyces microflavus]
MFRAGPLGVSAFARPERWASCTDRVPQIRTPHMKGMPLRAIDS